MTDIILTDKTKIPDVELLKATLKKTYSFFDELIELTRTFIHEWKFYNKKSGWTLKVFDKKKTLFWITPLNGTFNIGFALRETEKDHLLKSKMSEDIIKLINSAEKYPEGYALRLNVNDDKYKDDLIELINILTILRKK